MGDRRSAHLPDEQLGQFPDEVLSSSDLSHLDTCSHCGSRLRELQATGTAYVAYRDSIRGPALPPAPKPWPSLGALIAEYEVSHPRRVWRWWLVPALAAALVIVIVVLRRPMERPAMQASELLTQSARVQLPPNRTISMRLHGRTQVRPAVLITESPAERDPDLVHLQVVFAAAHYSWRDPLSARSFQSWRSGLRDKRDRVSVIRAGSEDQAYRVQTDTTGGVLRSASLTLRGKDLRPTSGAFRFEGEDRLEMDEAQTPVPRASQQQPAAPKQLQVETPASPADTLHVLAALNEIGADVGEPVDVSEDPQHHVVVHTIGLNADRRQQIADALKSLPRVKLVLGDVPSDARLAGTRPAAPERFSTGIPAGLRQQFEARLGGAIALQEMTDRVLETSGSAVSRAHAIEVLADKFPRPTESSLRVQDRELLLKLRQRHLSELQRLVQKIRMDLNPLLATSNNSRPSAGIENRVQPAWQTQAPALVASAQGIDDSLNRLLAGSYSQSSGEAMLLGLAEQLRGLEQLIQVQPEGGR